MFAVIAEEFGLIACVALLGLFGFVTLRGLQRTELVADRFTLLAASLLAHFGLQAIGNIGVNLSVLPATGVTLPFISYGGLAVCSGPGHGAVSRPDAPASERGGAAMSRPVVIAAGGTGGHMFPALSLAAELRARGPAVVIACDARGARYLEPGIDHHLIQAASPTGRWRVRLAGLGRLTLGFGQGLRLLHSARPTVAAFGGYAAVPIGLAAAVLRIRSWCTSRMRCSAGQIG